MATNSVDGAGGDDGTVGGFDVVGITVLGSIVDGLEHVGLVVVGLSVDSFDELTISFALPPQFLAARS